MTDIPHKKEPMAGSAEVCCPQRRAHSGTESNQLAGSQNPETKHEARRAPTSEFGLTHREQDPAGFLAPAGYRLIVELEIDAAIEEFLRARGCGNPQPVVTLLDAMPGPNEEDDDGWDELTAKLKTMVPAPGQKTFAERMLDRMDA